MPNTAYLQIAFMTLDCVVDNDIRNQGAEVLAKALKTNITVTSIDLSSKCCEVHV